MLLRVLALIFGLGLAVGVTGPKLYKMAQIKGWLPGGTAVDRTVTQKWHQPPDQHPRGRNTYWVGTTEEDIRKAGPHRLNLPAEEWKMLKEGDKIEIISVPGDPTPYMRDGIFVSWENVSFDLALLGAEVGVVSISPWQMLSYQLSVFPLRRSADAALAGKVVKFNVQIVHRIVGV